MHPPTLDAKFLAASDLGLASGTELSQISPSFPGMEPGPAGERDAHPGGFVWGALLRRPLQGKVADARLWAESLDSVLRSSAQRSDETESRFHRLNRATRPRFGGS